MSLPRLTEMRKVCRVVRTSLETFKDGTACINTRSVCSPNHTCELANGELCFALHGAFLACFEKGYNDCKPVTEHMKGKQQVGTSQEGMLTYIPHVLASGRTDSELKKPTE